MGRSIPIDTRKCKCFDSHFDEAPIKSPPKTPIERAIKEPEKGNNQAHPNTNMKTSTNFFIILFLYNIKHSYLTIVEWEGLEPSTNRLKAYCSTIELPFQVSHIASIKMLALTYTATRKAACINSFISILSWLA